MLPADNAACTRDRGIERRLSGPNGNPAGDWSPDGANGSCQNLITAEVPYDFLEPSLNDAYPVVGNWWDDTFNIPLAIGGAFFAAENRNVINHANTAVEQRGADAFSMTIQRASAINEWAINPQTGTDTSWVITFPTKQFYVDKGDARQFAVWADGDSLRNRLRCDAAAPLSPRRRTVSTLPIRPSRRPSCPTEPVRLARLQTARPATT